jgi:hypothetical protein
MDRQEKRIGTAPPGRSQGRQGFLGFEAANAKFLPLTCISSGEEVSSPDPGDWDIGGSSK